MTKVQYIICDMCKRGFDTDSGPTPLPIGEDHPLNKLMREQPNPKPAFEHVCDACKQAVRVAILALVKGPTEKGGT